MPSKTSSTPALSSITPFFFDAPASKAFRKYEIAEDIAGNCPPSDLGTTHLRRRVLFTEADEKISGKRSAFSNPSRTPRKSLTCGRCAVGIRGEIPSADKPRIRYAHDTKSKKPLVVKT